MPQPDWTNLLKNYSKENPLLKSRLDLHNVWNDTFCDTGLCPFPEEIEYGNPKKDKGEDLFIYGSNTGEKTTIEVYFKRRPLPISGRFDAAKDQVVVSFILRDEQGDTYTLDESSTVKFNDREYRASGFAYESLQSNKIGRIKYRGFLKRNDEETPVFVKIRFLCLFFSKLFDHQRHFNIKCMARQLKNSTDSVDSIADLLEDKLEQFCQIKGTFKVESQVERELFFLGAVGRRFLPTKELPPRKVTKISGFDVDGTGFSIGLVSQANFSYLYGYSSKRGENFNVLKKFEPLTAESFSQMLTKQESFEFSVRLSKKTQLKFEVSPYKGQSRLVKVNGVEGMCFIDERIFDEVERKLDPHFQFVEKEFADTLVVSLFEDAAKLTQLTGGKGSSLAQLKRLSQQQSFSSEERCFSWEVPNAVVVTSSAYQVQTSSMEGFAERVTQLATEAAQGTSAQVKEKCDLFVNWFASHRLHKTIAHDLNEKMVAEFGAQWTSPETLYAVRSSASGEDSSEMSAAGQMTTYLGVTGGLEVICKAIVACWASQFAFVPVQYKRGYGQTINAPMAVVVQQMVDCSAAGVLFTADPTDGDERRMTVTANYGLGESVVSAAAEPDTFTLEVDIVANSYQVVRTIKQEVVGKVLGKKGIVTRLNLPPTDDLAELERRRLEDGIRIDQLADGLENQSIADEDLLRLGDVALQITSHYGSPRDIEWGIAHNELYIFQARPITNLDGGFTAYELMHEVDSPHMCESEIYSRHHWGEILPGSCTWMGVFFMTTECLFIRQQIQQMGWTEAAYNPYRPVMGILYNQVMFNMKQDFVQGMFNQYPESSIITALVYAFFGHDITDEDVLESFRRSRDRLSPTASQKLKMLGQVYEMLVKGPKQIPALKQAVIEENRGEIAAPMQYVPLSMEKLHFVLKKVFVNFDEGHIHSGTLLGSTVKSMLLMKGLGGEDRARREADHNLLLSHCNDVVSVELPNFLRRIAAALKDREAFAALSDEEALRVLQDAGKSGEEEAAKLFEEFLHKHGHRGHRETDAYHLPLCMKPSPAVQVIKSLIKNKVDLEKSAKEAKSVDELLSQLQTPLSAFKRWLIKRYLLKWCQNAVGYRENTKSILMKHQHQMREALWQIAEQMAAKGLVPEAELFFFLKSNEVAAMIDDTAKNQKQKQQNVALYVWKAKQRKRLWPTMDVYRFDEFIKGFRMTHRPSRSEQIVVEDNVTPLKGTAVTVGAVKGRVCVAETIEEAALIEEGDILITYSTDIGWTPYFSLISGIVTEIGGTISHGAVVAREIGIPCLISVDNVCNRFKTGDIAYVDCKTASIVKVAKE